jgi:hypothetical protein
MAQIWAATRMSLLRPLGRKAVRIFSKQRIFARIGRFPPKNWLY